MTTIGFIGAGHVGSNLAELAIRHGNDVVISNSRGPETLADLVGRLGPQARAASREEAATAGEIVVVTTPLAGIADYPADALEGKVVIDTDNYYPDRDGHIAELDDESITTSEMVQRALPGSKVVKAFNHIIAAELNRDGTPAGTPGRRALAVFSDDAVAKAQVSALIDAWGFDPVDGGDLAESWRLQRDTPGYVQNDTAAELEAHLAEAKRYRDL